MEYGSVRGRTEGEGEAIGTDGPSHDPRFVELCADPVLWSVLAAATDSVSRSELAERTGVDGRRLEEILELALLHGVLAERWVRAGSGGGRTVETALDAAGLETVAAAL